MSRVFTNGPGDQGSILGRVIPKNQKMVLDATLLDTQHYKVLIKGKVEQSKEWSSDLPYTLVWLLLKREPSGHPRLSSPPLLTIVWVLTLIPIQTFDEVFQNNFCLYIKLATQFLRRFSR